MSVRILVRHRWVRVVNRPSGKRLLLGLTDRDGNSRYLRPRPSMTLSGHLVFFAANAQGTSPQVRLK